jgi:hypothetical protein
MWFACGPHYEEMSRRVESFLEDTVRLQLSAAAITAYRMVHPATTPFSYSTKMTHQWPQYQIE